MKTYGIFSEDQKQKGDTFLYFKSDNIEKVVVTEVVWSNNEDEARKFFKTKSFKYKFIGEIGEFIKIFTHSCDRF